MYDSFVSNLVTVPDHRASGTTLAVTGVLADFSANSSINYDVIFPMDLWAQIILRNGEWKPMDEDLGNFLYTTYLQLKPTGVPAAVQQKLSTIYRDKIGADAKTDLRPAPTLPGVVLR